MSCGAYHAPQASSGSRVPCVFDKEDRPPSLFFARWCEHIVVCYAATYMIQHTLSWLLRGYTLVTLVTLWLHYGYTLVTHWLHIGYTMLTLWCKHTSDFEKAEKVRKSLKKLKKFEKV